MRKLLFSSNRFGSNIGFYFGLGESKAACMCLCLSVCVCVFGRGIGEKEDTGEMAVYPSIATTFLNHSFIEILLIYNIDKFKVLMVRYMNILQNDYHNKVIEHLYLLM